MIKKRGPWTTVDEVELAIARWVDWWNYRRLLGPVGDIPPAEFKAAYRDEHAASVVARNLTQDSPKNRGDSIRGLVGLGIRIWEP